MNKQALRDEYKARREALSEDELEEKSRLICDFAIDYLAPLHGKCIHLFLPIGKYQELDTWPLYEFLVGNITQTTVLSKTHWKRKTLTHHPMNPKDEIRVSKLGIPEPVHDRKIDMEKIDIILVPLLAFDRKGNRLGYGAGFYDRFLADCPKALKIGLSVLPMSSELLPKEDHDIPLDLCITDQGLIDFSAA